jgi:hypothetical protein
MDMQAGTASLPTGVAAAGGFWRLLRKSIGAHGILLGLALVYLTVFELLSASVPALAATSGADVMIGIVSFSLPMALFALLGFKFIEMAIYEKPLWRNFRGVLVDRERMAAVIPLFSALVVFMYVFTVMKSYISLLVPFSWDRTLDQWDVALHFGYRPWELLQPLLGYWPVTFLVNFNYNLWFVVMNVFWVYYAFIAKPGPERTRFFLSFMTIWIVGGSLAAIFFSSAGPCYFTRIGLSPDPYTPLMAYLAQANEYLPIWALGTQDMLWGFHQEGSALGGVSAMPSMHNATALLFILTSTRRPIWARRLLWGHGLLIFLGSIHLGWHYAVDSYLAWGLAFAVWVLMGPVAKRWEETRTARNYTNALTAGA